MTVTAATAAEYLRGRGVLPAGPDVRVESLDGGVSNEVFGVGPDLVLKRALPALRVAAEWHADPHRAVTEAAAIELAGRLCPGRVPSVVDVDPDALMLTITRAPGRLANLRDSLFAGHADPATAEALGTALAAWHAGTADDPAVRERFDGEVFRQLRLDPFHGEVARRLPAVADRIGVLIEELSGVRACLVHGDFSPKNVLADGADVVVIDWEVAHAGNPVFDLAFLHCHLVLKALVRPGSGPAFERFSEVFLAAYAAGVPASLLPSEPSLAAHTAALLLARVVGKSPAGYLGGGQRKRVTRLGVAALEDPAGGLSGLWRATHE